MDENLSLYTLVLIVSLVLSGFFSASETALISLGKIRLHQLKERHRRLGPLVNRLAEHPERILSAVLLGNNLVNTAATAAGTAIAIVIYPSHPVLVATGALTLLLLIFAEITPKTIAARHADLVSLVVAQPLHLFARLASPLVRVLSVIPRFFLWPFGSSGARTYPTLDDIKTLAILGREEGVIGEAEKNIIHSVVEFGSIDVDQIMVPRVDIKGANLSLPIGEILEQVIESGHTRIPIYRESLDKIVGLIYARDLLAAWRNGEVSTLDDLVHPPFFVSEHQKVSTLFQEFRARKVRMAIVVDEYGGTAGLVTLDDILGEIVGELVNDYQRRAQEITRRPDGTLIVSGQISVEDLNREVGLALPDQDFQTLSGLIVNNLGRVPYVGEEIREQGLELHVLDADQRRIYKLSIKNIPRTPHNFPPKN